MQRTCLFALFFAAPLLHADPLTQADREALIEKLDNLSESAKEKAMGRLGSAAAAFRAGMASDKAAVELYLKCVQKVEFEDRKRSSQDFREWERQQGDRLKDEGLGRCLRHQLRWLVLTLEAAEAGEKREAMAPKAAEALDAIFGNPEQFGGRIDTLKEPVNATVFARAFNLDGAKIESWPLSPLDVAQVFNQVLLPPLRKAGKYPALREQWLKRIRFEGLMIEHWGAEEKDKERGRERGRERDPNDDQEKERRQADHQKFLTETLPELRWEMEEDLFKAGDQKLAAMNMLQQLEENVTHPKAREWAGQFRTLIEPPKPLVTPPAATAETGAP